MASLKRKLDGLIELFEGLAEEAKKGTPIVVEGPSDVNALRSMGLEGNFLCIKATRKSLFEFSRGLQKYPKIIILTDFDRRGVLTAKNLIKYLEKKKVKVNLFFWKKMRRLVKKDVKDVQGMPSYIETLKRRTSF